MRQKTNQPSSEAEQPASVLEKEGRGIIAKAARIAADGAGSRAHIENAKIKA